MKLKQQQTGSPSRKSLRSHVWHSAPGCQLRRQATTPARPHQPSQLVHAECCSANICKSAVLSGLGGPPPAHAIVLAKGRPQDRHCPPPPPPRVASMICLQNTGRILPVATSTCRLRDMALQRHKSDDSDRQWSRKQSLLHLWPDPLPSQFCHPAEGGLACCLVGAPSI